MPQGAYPDPEPLGHDLRNLVLALDLRLEMLPIPDEERRQFALITHRMMILADRLSAPPPQGS